VEIAAWAGASSFVSLGKGFMNGAIDVLPEKSFLSNCKANSTDLYDSSKEFSTHYKAKETEDALTSL
jgi:hypothetical protein